MMHLFPELLQRVFKDSGHAGYKLAATSKSNYAFFANDSFLTSRWKHYKDLIQTLTYIRQISNDRQSSAYLLENIELKILKRIALIDFEFAKKMSTSCSNKSLALFKIAKAHSSNYPLESLAILQELQPRYQSILRRLVAKRVVQSHPELALSLVVESDDKNKFLSEELSLIRTALEILPVSGAIEFVESIKNVSLQTQAWTVAAKVYWQINDTLALKWAFGALQSIETLPYLLKMTVQHDLLETIAKIDLPKAVTLIETIQDIHEKAYAKLIAYLAAERYNEHEIENIVRIIHPNSSDSLDTQMYKYRLSHLLIKCLKIFKRDFKIAIAYQLMDIAVQRGEMDALVKIACRIRLESPPLCKKALIEARAVLPALTNGVVAGKSICKVGNIDPDSALEMIQCTYNIAKVSQIRYGYEICKKLAKNWPKQIKEFNIRNWKNAEKIKNPVSKTQYLWMCLKVDFLTDQRHVFINSAILLENLHNCIVLGKFPVFSMDVPSYLKLINPEVLNGIISLMADDQCEVKALALLAKIKNTETGGTLLKKAPGC